MKKTRSCAAARNKVIPAAEDFVHTAADRVGPLAQSAADRVAPLVEAAADRIGSAADKLSPLAHSAAGAVTPYAHQAADRLTPLATSVKERGADLLHDASELLGPRLDDARDRVGPAVGAARDKVSDELLPKLTEVLAAAAASPLAVEAISRGRATLAAATGELALPPEKPKRRWPKRLAVIAALAGLAYVVARKFLGSKDSEWQTARPTTPYVPPKSSVPTTPAAAAATTAAATTEADVPTAENEVPGDDPQAGASAHTEYLDANGIAEPDQPAEGGVEESEDVLSDDEALSEATRPAQIVTDFGANDSAGTSFVADDFVADDFVAADVPAESTRSTGDDVAADETYGVADETAADLAYVTESDAEGGAELEPETGSPESNPER